MVEEARAVQHIVARHLKSAAALHLHRGTGVAERIGIAALEGLRCGAGMPPVTWTVPKNPFDTPFSSVVPGPLCRTIALFNEFANDPLKVRATAGAKSSTPLVFDPKVTLPGRALLAVIRSVPLPPCPRDVPPVQVQIGRAHV